MPASARHPGVGSGPRSARTMSAIIDATREVFLKRGYAGTTIDEIAQLAGVSRPSFYTYFGSKRAALVALGADSLTGALAVIGALALVERETLEEGLAAWVARYFAYLDEYGSLAFAWTQAAHEDEEIRVAGQQGHLRMCRQLGLALGRLRGEEPDHPAEDGLLVVSMLERAWAYASLYGPAVDESALRSLATRSLAASLAVG
jgi:AcrR family transcriptional regulator